MDFTQRIDHLPPQIFSKIAKIDELKGQWVGGIKLHPQVLSRLKKFVLVTSTGASTRIEGAHLSDEDVEKLMRGISIQKFSDRDKQEGEEGSRNDRPISLHKESRPGHMNRRRHDNHADSQQHHDADLHESR